jgi:hypothetical protein
VLRAIIDLISSSRPMHLVIAGKAVTLTGLISISRTPSG